METTKKRGRPSKKATAEKTAPAYSISVNIGGQVYEGSGETMLEALGMLPVPKKIMNKTVVSLSHGEKKAELLMVPARAKRIFYFYAQPFLAKHFTMVLK